MTLPQFKLGWFVCALFTLLSVSAARAQQVEPPAPRPPVQAEIAAPGGPSENNYRIGAGDVLLIEVAGEPELKRKVKVAEQGTIRLPYLARELKIAGLTEHQAAALLSKEFLVILKEPQITVFIEEYHAASAGIAGAVHKPTRIPLTRELRIFDLLTIGGGLTDKAGSIVQLIHTKASEGEGLETIDLHELLRRPELNRVIRDGDLLNVPEVGVVYVTGNVNKPGQFALRETVKLSQALALAGGLAPDAKRKEIHLVRTNGPGQAAVTEQIISFDELIKNPQRDVVLRPYDIVLVPEATGAKQTRSLIQAFAGGLASALGWGILR